MKPRAYFFTIAVLVVAGMLGGCVAPGDIADLREAQGRYEIQMAEAIRDLESGEKTKPEFDVEAERAALERDMRMAEIEKRVEERTKELERTLEDSLETGGVVGTVALVGMYALRSYTRRRALEVQSEPASK